MAKEKTVEKSPAKAASKTVAVVEKKSLAAQPDDINAMLLEDQGAGLETIGRDDLSIPRIKVLQDLSPQVKKTEMGYIEGAEVGMLCDPITGQLWDGEKGIVLVPISYRRAHLEFWPRESKKGKGFVADHGADGDILNSTTKNEKGHNMTEKGTVVSVHAEYFVFLVDPKTGSYTPYVFSLASTQLKKSRMWNTMMNQLKVPNPSKPDVMICPAMFYRSYLITLVPERNDHGSWMGIKITPDAFTLELKGGENIYRAAREFRKSILEGKVSAAAPAGDEVAGAPANEADPM